MTVQNEGENPEINFENLTDEQKSQIEESEKFILDFKEEDFNDPDKAEELRKHHENLRTTVHQKRHYREKVTKLETEITGLKTPKTPKPNGDGQQAATVDDSRTVSIEFKQDHPELSRDVVNEIIAHAKAYNISPEEAFKKPVIQSYVRSLQKEEDIDEASIGSKNRGGSASGIEKKDWSNASEAEIAEQRRKVMGY